MPRPKIWDSSHQAYTIHNWITSGLILREGETYKGIYSFVRSVDNCQLCSVKFTDEVNNEWRCMDHSHETGFFRQVLCNKCNKGFDKELRKNTKTGHRWISPSIIKRKSGVSVTFQYRRTGFKRKANKSLTKMICYSFIQLIKIKT